MLTMLAEGIFSLVGIIVCREMSYGECPDGNHMLCFVMGR